MRVKKYLQRTAATSGTALMLSIGMAAVSQPANAVWVGAWDTQRCYGANMCLFYSPGAQGATWGGLYDVWEFQYGVHKFSGGGAGNGQDVRNNAASAENGSNNAFMSIHEFPGYTGRKAELGKRRGGDLAGAGLRNNEASMKWFW